MPKKSQTTSRTKPADRLPSARLPARPTAKPTVKIEKSSAQRRGGIIDRDRDRALSNERSSERVKPASTTARHGSSGKMSRPRLAFADALAGLRSLLEPYRDRLEVVADSHDTLMLNCTKPHQGKPLFFAGVTHRRSYVSFYLMPIYVFPELTHGVSPALTARKQGKSCFNFTSRDELLFAELGKLTERSFKHFAKKGML